jgi:hypothetical protein
MKRTTHLFALLLVCSLVASAQTGAGTQSAPPPATSSSKDTKADVKEKDDKKDKDKKDKKKDKDKDKKDKSGSDPLDTSAVFNERIANDVLGQIRDGLEGHSRRLMLSAFDSDKMDGYLSFEDQIDAFFERYEAFRVRFRISNVTVEGTKGVVLVDTEMEEVPRGGAQPVRKRAQLRFELELGRKGWRVVDFRDRNFFS